MKRIFLAVAMLVSFMSFAVTVTGAVDKPGVLGEESVALTEKLAGQYDTLIVRDFDAKGAELVNMDDGEKAKLAEILPEVVSILKESIVSRVKSKTKFNTVTGNGKSSGKAVILEGKFTKFNAGNGAAKVFLGWMAPEGAKTNITVSGRLIDAKSGKELATFSDTRSGGEGSTVGFVGYVFRIQAKDEGEEIGDFIGKLY